MIDEYYSSMDKCYKARDELPECGVQHQGRALLYNQNDKDYIMDD
jgi:hypothetical protein